SARRDMRVLRHPERFEVARLGLARQLVDADGGLGGGDADADLHGILLVQLGPVAPGPGVRGKGVWGASPRPFRRWNASVQRPGRGKVPPSASTPRESHVAAIQPRSPLTAPRALSTSMVKSLMTGQTRRHCSRSTTSRPCTNGATVPNATMS